MFYLGAVSVLQSAEICLGRCVAVCSFSCMLQPELGQSGCGYELASQMSTSCSRDDEHELVLALGFLGHFSHRHPPPPGHVGASPHRAIGE